MWILPDWGNRPNGKKPATLTTSLTTSFGRRWEKGSHAAMEGGSRLGIANAGRSNTRLQAARGIGGRLGMVGGLVVWLAGWVFGNPAVQAQQIPHQTAALQPPQQTNVPQTPPQAQQDVVEWDPGGSGVGRARLSGRVIDYTGEFLLLQLPDGREQKIPGQKVLRIETQYTPAHQEAEQRFRQGRLAEAIGLYRKAIQEEQRRWVRREILARMVVCYEDTGQASAAGETFLLLVQSDPNTPYWEVIPLAWAPGAPDGLLERQARQWLAQDVQQSPSAVLLGASHLLSGAERGAALERLNQLVRHPDQRISFLALTQTWRTLVQVEPTQLETWERTIQKAPAALRPGPYYVLGRAWAQQGRWEEAALAWLRVPILYGRPRSLAARALVEAGAALQRLGQTEQAARLYQELLRTYPDSPSATEAAQRLEELQNQSPPPKP